MKRVLLVTLLLVVVLFVMYTRRKKTSEYVIPKDYIGSVAQDDASRQAAADSYILENCPSIESDTTSVNFLEFKQAVDDIGTGYMAIWPLTISTYTGTQPVGETVYTYKSAYEFPFWAQIASTADMRGAWFKYLIAKCPQLFAIDEQLAFSKWSYNPNLITNGRVTKWSQSAGTDGIFSGQTVLEVPSTSTEAWESVAIDPVTNLPTTRSAAMMLFGPASMIEYPAETSLYAFTSQTFTPAGATGQYGPSQTQVNTAYGATFAARVSVVNGIQKWTVPLTGMYIFDVKGGAGSLNWAKGRRLRGVVPLFKGEIINILVGQMGATTSTVSTLGYAGGGGGTFIVRDNGTVPLIIAAGGVGNYTGRPTPYVADPAETRVTDGAPVDESSIYPFNYNTTWAITKYGPVVRSDYTLPTDPNALATLYRFPPPFGDISNRTGGGFQYSSSSTAGVSTGASYINGGNGGGYFSKGFGGFGGGSARTEYAAAGGYYGGYTNSGSGGVGVMLPASSFLDGSVIYPDDTLTGDNDGFAKFTLCAAGSYIDTTTYTCTTCSTAGSYCPRNTDAVYTCPAGEYCSTAATRAPCTNTSYYCPAGATSQTQAAYQCSSPTPSTLQYVSAVCTRKTDTVMLTAPACNLASRYRKGFSQGSSGATGASGSCTACTLPASADSLQYVSAVCTTTSDTVISTATPCTAGNYRSAFSQGSYGATGSVTCSPCTNTSYYCPAGSTSQTQAANFCSSPATTILQYVTAACTRADNTVMATAPACTAGNYRSGFSRGSSGATGASGSCTACTTPGYYCPAGSSTSQTAYQCSSPGNPTGSTTSFQYVSAVCTRTADTTISYASAMCNAGNYYSGFSSGSSGATGTVGSCTVCTTPGYYCPAGSSTSQTAYPCTICTASQYEAYACTRSTNTDCRAKKAYGNLCTSPTQCTSGQCVSMYCA